MQSFDFSYDAPLTADYNVYQKDLKLSIECKKRIAYRQYLMTDKKAIDKNLGKLFDNKFWIKVAAVMTGQVVGIITVINYFF